MRTLDETLDGSLDQATFDIVEALLRKADKELAPSPYRYPLAHATYGSHEVAAALLAMLRRKTSMWETTRSFEQAFVGHQFPDRTDLDAVMVNSGSSADLLCAFVARPESLDLMPAGSEVLVPAVTWSTHLWSIMMAGYKPVLVDVDPLTFNIDLEDAGRKVTTRTRGLFLVHLMGFPMDMGSIERFVEEHDLCLMEDCCESLGASWGDKKVGQFGKVASFSFFFSHHMTTMEGGIIVAPHEFIEELRLLRAHGWSRGVTSNSKAEFSTLDGIDPRYRFEGWGFNVRPTELNAAFGLQQLVRLDSLNDNRQRNYDVIRSFVSDECPGVTFPELPPLGRANPFAVAFTCPPGWRQPMQNHLESMGVETRSLVAGNLGRHPAAKRLGLEWSGLDGADRLHFDGMYIGLHASDDSSAETEFAARAVVEAYRAVESELS